MVSQSGAVARVPAASTGASLPGRPSLIPYIVSGLMNTIYCVECGDILGDLFGVVFCNGCNTKYMIKKIISLEPWYFLKGEADKKEVSLIVDPIRIPTLPGKNAHKIVEIEASPNEEVEELSPTFCVLCRERLESILSIRVQVMKGVIEKDYTEIIKGVEVPTFREIPLFSVGRAHKECALDPKNHKRVKILNEQGNTSKEGIRTVPLSKYGTRYSDTLTKDRVKPSGDVTALIEIEDP